MFGSWCTTFGASIPVATLAMERQKLVEFPDKKSQAHVEFRGKKMVGINIEINSELVSSFPVWISAQYILLSHRIDLWLNLTPF